MDARLGSMLLVFVAFTGLTLLAVRRAGWRGWLASRTGPEWVLDGAGLLVQGIAVPLLQAWLVGQGLRWLVPGWEGVLAVPAWAAFALVFVGVDYAYYWNHRALHARALWPLHRVHHASRTLDAWATSRNTLWTPLFIVYLWLNGALLFLTGQEAAILWAAGLSSALDLWRHGGKPLPAAWEGLARLALVTPTDHAWHHSADLVDVNFGANLNVWDRLHGTYHPAPAPPERLGVDVSPSLLHRLVWPFA